MEGAGVGLALSTGFQVILTLTGIPRGVTRLMQRTERAASTCWRSKLLALRPGPVIALVRAIAVSASERRWEWVSCLS